jgi:hypothetical protein
MKTLFCVIVFLFSSLAWALPNDQYGRTVSMVTQSGNDVYTVTGTGSSFTVSYPHGTSQSQAYSSINAHAPAGYVPAAPLLSQTMTPAQYGQYLIDQFTAGNAQRGLTTSQLFSLAQTLGPYYILLQTGALESFLANIGNIPVDGIVITNATITQFQQAIQGYEAGVI